MPFLKIETNVSVDEAAVAAKASAHAAGLLGKPEQYVLVVVESGRTLFFGGSDQAAAFVTLKSLGLEEGRCKALSAELCDFLEAELGIPKNRVYIEFAGPPAAMFGWNGGTFG